MANEKTVATMENCTENKGFIDYLSSMNYTLGKFKKLRKSSREMLIDSYNKTLSTTEEPTETPEETETVETTTETTETAAPTAETTTACGKKRKAKKAKKETEKKAEKPAKLVMPTETELEKLIHAAITKNVKESGEFSTHVDPKKKKVMVRWNGSKMLFKVFIQRGGVKAHLKTEEMWKHYSDSVETFFQNGFNLPYACKMSLEDFTTSFLPWVFTEGLAMVTARRKKSEKPTEETTTETAEE